MPVLTFHISFPVHNLRQTPQQLGVARRVLHPAQILAMRNGSEHPGGHAEGAALPDPDPMHLPVLQAQDVELLPPRLCSTWGRCYLKMALGGDWFRPMHSRATA